SAELNFAADKLDRDPDGTYRTYIVRRSRPENEGPDDVSPSGYRAELIPLRFQVVADQTSRRLRAKIDITGFSSWARRDQPAPVTFGPDRHLQSVPSKLMLGPTSQAPGPTAPLMPSRRGTIWSGWVRSCCASPRRRPSASTSPSPSTSRLAVPRPMSWPRWRGSDCAPHSSPRCPRITSGATPPSPTPLPPGSTARASFPR